MTYEVPDVGSGRGQPKISMRESGSIGINSRALEEYFEDYEYAQVQNGKGEDEGNLALKPTNDPDGKATYTISRSGSSGSVTPSSFLKSNNLIPEQTTQYIPQVEETEDGEEVVVIDLNEDGMKYGSATEEE